MQLVKSSVYLVKNLWPVLTALVVAGIFLKGPYAIITVPILCILLTHVTEYSLEGKVKTTLFYGFRWRQAETHFLIYAIFLFAMLVLFISLPAIITAQLSEDASLSTVLGLVIVSISFILFTLSRLFLVFPLIIKRGTIGIKESWAMTEKVWYKTFILVALFHGAVVGLFIFVKSPYVEILASIFQAMLAANVYKKIK
jgi:hypothetical protein